MLQLDFRIQRFFFDREGVISKVEKGRRGAMSRVGGLTRLIARRSIRKAGRKTPPSPAGRPPRSRTGALRDYIFYAYDPKTDSVVCGPAKLNQIFLRNGRPTKGTVPEILEEGGRAGVVEQRYTNNFSPDAWRRADLRRNKDSEKYDYRIRYYNVAARPYMAPAFDLAMKQLPQFLTRLI